MTFHEFGKENEDILLLLHPAAVRWDYFEEVIPLLQSRYHLIVPAIPGYDPNDAGSDFTSVEAIAKEIGQWLQDQEYRHIHVVYGCSMGGSIALMIALDQAVTMDHCVMDGGITPYQLPWLATRWIALRDYLMVSAGKLGGLPLLEKAFSTDEYSREDLKYIADVLKHCSRKTLWRTFDSCNNYKVPDPLPEMDTKIHYWYAEHEAKERAWDLNFMKKFFPQTRFCLLSGLGHAGFVTQRPDQFARWISAL